MSQYDFFTKRLNDFKTQEIRLKRKSGNISNIRLLVFIASLTAFGLLYFSPYRQWSYIAAILGLVLFLSLIVVHKNVLRNLSLVQNKAALNKKCIDRISGEWVNFSDKGNEFINADHPYSSDLDIFGDKSLFQWLSTARTYYGRYKLFEALANPVREIPLMLKRQNAIKEIAGKIDFCQNVQSEAMLMEDSQNNPEALLKYAEDKKFLFKNKSLYALITAFPIALLISVVLLAFKANIPAVIPLALLLVQSFIFLIGALISLFKLANAGSFKDKVSVYLRIIKIIENENFNDEYINEIKGDLYKESKSASKALKELERIADFIDLRHSPMMYFALNLIFLWDLHCVYALEKWKRQYGSRIRIWIDCIARFEEIISLGGISQIHPEWAFPEFDQRGLVVRAEGMGHPMINDDKRVANNININNNICVITGSNMSGKTTLLRTTGVNLVLAYAGAAVCASSFTCSVMDIYTSMRINDDLSEGISTFYAELLRIKKIIDHSKKQQNMIFLIDEIFRGTNSRDRLTGAKSVIKNLNKKWITGLISTHDLELCDLDKVIGDKIKNYYFTERYEDNTIIFDYKLRSGRSNTTNAVYLMKMVGIDI